METKYLEYRMYGLVPYNISPIQQGIQFGHALQEYNNKISTKLGEDGGITFDTSFGKDYLRFKDWAENHKTFIILNGGTTNKNKLESTGQFKGTLNEHAFTLFNHDIEIATFFEPDLGEQLTAVVFLVDERVFDKKKYPDFEGFSEGDWLMGGEYRNRKREKWVESVGGEKNVWLREFLSQFRLA